MFQFILIVKHPYSIVWWHVKAFMEFGVLIRAMMEDMAQSLPFSQRNRHQEVIDRRTRLR